MQKDLLNHLYAHAIKVQKQSNPFLLRIWEIIFLISKNELKFLNSDRSTCSYSLKCTAQLSSNLTKNSNG